jgi:hypothetical protein
MYDSWDAGTWAWMVVVMLLFVGALIFGSSRWFGRLIAIGIGTAPRRKPLKTPSAFWTTGSPEARSTLRNTLSAVGS